MKPTIQTYTGQMVDLVSPDPATLNLTDICHSLSTVNRFAGHTRFPVSVGAHSLMVARAAYAESGKMIDYVWGLLHDASEAYLNDVTRPIKHHAGMAFYRECEANVMRVICEKFGLPPEEPPVVKRNDMRVLATERRDAHLHLVPWELDSHPDFVPLDEKVTARDWRDTRNELRLQLNLCLPKHAIAWSAYNF